MSDIDAAKKRLEEALDTIRSFCSVKRSDIRLLLAELVAEQARADDAVEWIGCVRDELVNAGLMEPGDRTMALAAIRRMIEALRPAAPSKPRDRADVPCLSGAEYTHEDCIKAAAAPDPKLLAAALSDRERHPDHYYDPTPSEDRQTIYHTKGCTVDRKKGIACTCRSERR